MEKYSRLEMVINGNERVTLYDGKDFMNFERLAELCGCKKIKFMGKGVMDDNDLYIDINDKVMDGITESNPSGEWKDDKTWTWGIHINDNYVEFVYEV